MSAMLSCVVSPSGLAGEMSSRGSCCSAPSGIFTVAVLSSYALTETFEKLSSALTAGDPSAFTVDIGRRLRHAGKVWSRGITGMYLRSCACLAGSLQGFAGVISAASEALHGVLNFAVVHAVLALRGLPELGV